MQTAEVTVRFAEMDQSQKKSTEEYNFTRFRSKHLLSDAWRTWKGTGIQPGEIAPDFTMPKLSGGTVSLSELRGKPMLLHFGSFT